MSNGLEYGIGAKPLVSDANALPKVSRTEATPGSGIRYLTLTYQRVTGVDRPTDLAWTVQRNTGLNPADWSALGVAAEEVTPGPAGSNYETVVVRSQTALGSAGALREFLRLSVTLTAPIAPRPVGIPSLVVLAAAEGPATNLDATTDSEGAAWRAPLLGATQPLAGSTEVPRPMPPAQSGLARTRSQPEQANDFSARSPANQAPELPIAMSDRQMRRQTF